MTQKCGHLAVVHNGNLANTEELRTHFRPSGRHFSDHQRHLTHPHAIAHGATAPSVEEAV